MWRTYTFRNAQRNAEAYAREGKKGKAVANTIESIAEFSTSAVFCGALAGYESGLKGTLIGAGFGTLAAAVSAKEIISDVWQAGKEGNLEDVYRKFGIVPLSGIPKKELLTSIPPVYSAQSIESMQNFREAQKKISWRNKFHIKNVSDIPEGLSSRDFTAIFFLQDVTHYPVLDPKERKVMKKLTEEDPAIKLTGSSEASLIAKPLTNIDFFWPYESTFKNENILSDFDWDNWKYFKENSWKSDVLVLAQYQMNRNFLEEATGRKKTTTSNIVDQYWLVSLVDDEGKLRRRKKEKKEIELSPTPVFKPAPHVLN